jgi:hypothetical protein
MKLSSIGLGAILACLASVPMNAADIVLDPGFEAGGQSCSVAATCTPLYPAWTFIDAAGGSDYGVSYDDPFVHTGRGTAFFANLVSGSYDVIQQPLATTPGQFYTLSFWLDTSHNHSDADFQVYWNGTLIYDDPAGTDAAHRFSYTQFTLSSLQATGSSTVLKFAGYNAPSADYLDDVVVDSGDSGVPEPATWGLTCGAVLAMALRRVRTRRPSRIEA